MERCRKNQVLEFKRIMFLTIACMLCFIFSQTIFAAEDKGKLNKKIYRDRIYGSETQDSFYYVSENYELVRYDLTKGKATVVKKMDKGSCHSNELFYKDDCFYFIVSKIDENNMFTDFYVEKIDMKSGKASKYMSVPKDISYNVSDFVLDDAGNVYFYDNGYIAVFSKSGKKIAKSKKLNIDDLICVDSTNGNIYYTGNYNWVYWGYDHDMNSLKVARLNKDKTFTYGDDKPISLLYQSYWYERYGSVEMFGDNYLAVLSTFSGNVLYLLDSKKVSPKNLTNSSTSISILDSSVSVSGVNLSNKSATVLAAYTRDNKYSDATRSGFDVDTIGTRSAYHGKTNSLFVADKEKKINIYDVKTKKKGGTLNTKRPIHKLLMVKNRLVAIEKTTKSLYVEAFAINTPTKISLTGVKSLKVGEAAKFKAKVNSDVVPDIVFSSSNGKVLSIDKEGNAAAWCRGKATITASCLNGKLKSKVYVTVSDRKLSYTLKQNIKINGKKTNNENNQDYRTWSKAVSSHIVQINKNKYMRVESLSNGTIYVEYFNDKGKVLSKKNIKKQLEEIAGFYAGKDYYFAVFYANNYSEKKDKVVLRVVKYNKNWKQLGSCSIKDINTCGPVDAGSMRMDEYNGVLYIHTCHEMYKSEDGFNHQANMTFEINEKTMKIKDSYTGVMNLSYGYVSHSFNQFIKIQNGMVYRVDHGDAYPRGIAFSKYDAKKGSMTKPLAYGSLVGFNGNTGYNYTGASVGGMEVSNTHVLVAYNQDEGNSNVRNIKVVSLNDKSGSTTERKITGYKSSSDTTCSTPQLVEITNNHYLLMWVESGKSDGKFKRVGMVNLDAAGKKIGKVYYSKNLRLSDCQPILLSNKTVGWYVSNNAGVKMYNVNPFKLDKVN